MAREDDGRKEGGGGRALPPFSFFLFWSGFPSRGDGVGGGEGEGVGVGVVLCVRRRPKAFFEIVSHSSSYPPPPFFRTRKRSEAATLSLVFETEEDFFLPLRSFRKGEILCSQSPKGKSRLCARGARSNCPLLTCFLMAGAMFSFLSFKMMLSAW